MNFLNVFLIERLWVRRSKAKREPRGAVCRPESLWRGGHVESVPIPISVVAKNHGTVNFKLVI